MSLYIASGCVLDLCTAFWTSLRELTLYTADSVAWNIIGVMHLLSVDCPSLEVRLRYHSFDPFSLFVQSLLTHMAPQSSCAFTNFTSFLQRLSISFATAGTFPIYNISPLVHMRYFHLASRTDCLDLDEDTLSYILRSLAMVNLQAVELEGTVKFPRSWHPLPHTHSRPIRHDCTE